MRLATRRAAALLVASVVAVTTAAAQPAQPSLAAVAAKRSDTPAKHLIWRVSKNGQTTAFLVGSIHVLTKASYPLSPTFDEVYKQTRVLVEEVDMGESSDPKTAMAVATKALMSDGQTLKTVLDQATYARVSDKASAAGLPMMVLDRMKPWLVAMTLLIPDLMRAGFDPSFGLDRHFYERAVADGRPVKGLETAAYQLDRLNGLTMPIQVEMLRATLDDVDTQVKSVQEIVTGWRTGDLPTLERLLLKEFTEAPELYQRLLVERNQNWIPAISECQASAPCMVVVGGAHLLGPDSVVALLTKAGFTLEQM